MKNFYAAPGQLARLRPLALLLVLLALLLAGRAARAQTSSGFTPTSGLAGTNLGAVTGVRFDTGALTTNFGLSRPPASQCAWAPKRCAWR